MTTRMDQLMLATAGVLDERRAPLDHAFLVEHDVSLDEAYALAEALALAARVWARTPVEIRRRHAIAAAAEIMAREVTTAVDAIGDLGDRR